MSIVVFATTRFSDRFKPHTYWVYLSSDMKTRRKANIGSDFRRLFARPAYIINLAFLKLLAWKEHWPEESFVGDRMSIWIDTSPVDIICW